MTTAPEQQRGRRKSPVRSMLYLAVVAVLLLVALPAAIGSLNRTVYSAGGFVEQYLDALARDDTIGALALAGVMPSDAQLTAAQLATDLPQTLLRASVLGSLTDIELVSDTESAPGVHTVQYEFRLDGKKSAMQFTVERAGNFAGVFDSWRFAVSPLAVLQVSVLQEHSFTVNGMTLDTRAHAAADAPTTFGTAASYLAFAPGRYVFTHDTAMLTAKSQSVYVTKSGANAVEVNTLPNAAMLKQVQAELNGFLDTCATQSVLQPTNCPFGITIDDRIDKAPVWSITDYPTVELAAGESSFEMAATAGRAHIVVEVQSLFDGGVNTRDEDVPFTMGLSVTIQPGGALAIQLH